jgi:ligand-binding sensor domain-containing protein
VRGKVGRATLHLGKTSGVRHHKKSHVGARGGLLILALAFVSNACDADPFDGVSAAQRRISTRTSSILLEEGNDIAFRRAENAEEFSQSRVGQIAQDDKGFMWFGTQYGLNRFDGYGRILFGPDARATNRLSGAFVFALLKDRSGRLWVASDQGLDMLDSRSGQFTRIGYAGDTGESASIQSIYEDRAGNFWLCTSAGLYGLDSMGRTRVHFRHDAEDPASLGSNDVKLAKETRDGTFWVANGAGLEALDRSTGRVLVSVPLAESREMGFIEDDQGLIWIHHAGATGLASFDRTTRTLSRYRFVDAAGKVLRHFGIYTSLEDREGGLWFGTAGAGLLRFDAEKRRFIRYRNDSSDPQSLGGDEIITLFQDQQDNIWVALHGMPINLFPARAPSFRKLPPRPADLRSRAGNMVNTTLVVDRDSLWMSFVGSLSGVDLKTGERTNLRERLNLHSDVISMAQDARGRVWLGTSGAGLVRVDRSGEVHRYEHDPANPKSIGHEVVNDVLVDHAQNVWLATWGGLSRFDEQRGEFETYRPAGMNPRYLALAEDARHQLWLATHLYGLQRFEPGTGKFTTYPAGAGAKGVSNGRVNAVHVDRRGIVWAGTQNGLDALDPVTGSIRSFHADDGLPGNAVSCILEDDDGGLWLGTNNGISRFDVSKGEFRSFTEADGLPGLDFTGWGSCHRTESGEMYFAGFAGATAFDPRHVRSLSFVPPVEFTDLTIAGESYSDLPANSRPLILPELDELTLPYSRNSLSAGFAAFSYTNPTSNRYRFRLAGLEEGWHSAGSDRRIASYNSLAPGSYRLEVQAAASGGPWSKTKALEFTILKPWWLTTQFRVAVAILVLALAWLAYRLRTHQLKRRFEIRLDERVAERTRIARELHDSLLQGFHGLMFRLQAVRNLLPARPLDAAQSLDDAMTRGDETVEQARVAVTDLRSFSSGATDLESALRTMVQGLPMPSRADAPDCRIAIEGQPRSMVPLVRDEVLQIAREAFRNAVLHAQAKVVRVEVGWGSARFSLRVRDDGVGLNEQVIAQGRDGHWGLQGMRERTRLVGGSLEIRSEYAVGTSVELGIPAARAYAK